MRNLKRWCVTSVLEGNAMRITGKLLKGIAVSAISLVGAIAYADTAPAGFDRSSIVRYADLNLNQPRDVAKLYSRITLAADKVCGPRSLVGSYSKRAQYQSCYVDTVSRAVAHVDEPSLSAYFRQRLPEPASREFSIAQQ